MAFIFSTSHLPEFGLPADHEEEEENVQPMPRAGGVRAFSHRPLPVRAQADFPEAGSASSPSEKRKDASHLAQTCRAIVSFSTSGINSDQA